MGWKKSIKILVSSYNLLYVDEDRLKNSEQWLDLSKYLTITIPQAQISSESISHKAEGQMGY